MHTAQPHQVHRHEADMQRLGSLRRVYERQRQRCGGSVPSLGEPFLRVRRIVCKVHGQRLVHRTSSRRDLQSRERGLRDDMQQRRRLHREQLVHERIVRVENAKRSAHSSLRRRHVHERDRRARMHQWSVRNERQFVRPS